MIRARDFGFGTFIQRRCFQSELSLAFFYEKEVKNPTQLVQQIWAEEIPLISLGENSHFHASWWHFSNYGPKYYSYLWSHIFACELFEKIRQGGLLNPEMGAAYVKAILSKGGSRDPEQMLIDFLGRKPTTGSFLKQLDL
jgi:oligopeptidase A